MVHHSGRSPQEFAGIYLPLNMDIRVPFRACVRQLGGLPPGHVWRLALVLAAIGLYGVVAYHVTLRTREIGIPMAIGAQPADALRMVLRQGLALTLLGVGIGLAASVGLARGMARLLCGVSPTDPPTYLAVSLLWLAVASAACYLPARRATRVDPTVALRYE